MAWDIENTRSVGLLKPEASVSPGDLLEMEILCPTTDLLIQKLWRWGLTICVLTNPSSDSVVD